MGSGLYGMLILAVVTVFISGLMVGRTRSTSGRSLAHARSNWHRSTFSSRFALALIGTGIAMSTETGRSSMLNSAAWAQRSAVRIYFGIEQQRVGIRRVVSEYGFLQHRTGGCDVPG